MRLDVLVVAPHPDDAELGMGGAIVKMLREGRSVGILDLTSGEPTPFGELATRQAETAQASAALGVTWRRNLELPNRRLEATWEGRARLAEVIRETRPRWLFTPYWVDAHPDHWAATELTEAARFWAKLTKITLAGEPYHPERIYHYFCVHLKLHPQPAFVLDISDCWEAKRQAVEAYQSQFVKGREHQSPTFLEQLEVEARYWGKSIGVRFGEPFASREPLGFSGWGNLI